MANVVVDVTSFPTVQTITNLVRSDIRDDMAGSTDTVGEGQILVDNLATSVTMANFFNSATREVCRKLRIVGAPMLIADNYILKNIPPMNGPLGFQVADPSVQVMIGFNFGFHVAGQEQRSRFARLLIDAHSAIVEVDVAA